MNNITSECNKFQIFCCYNAIIYYDNMTFILVSLLIFPGTKMAEIFKRIFLNEFGMISKFRFKLHLNVFQIANRSALVRVLPWHTGQATSYYLNLNQCGGGFLTKCSEWKEMHILYFISLATLKLRRGSKMIFFLHFHICNIWRLSAY